MDMIQVNVEADSVCIRNLSKVDEYLMVHPYILRRLHHLLA